MPRQFLCCLLAFFGWGIIYAQQVTLQVVTKSISQSLDYQEGDHLNIEGEKAEVEVITWAKTKIGVEMQLIAKHPERKIAEAELEKMKYEIIREGNQLYVRNFIELGEDESKPVSNLKAKLVVSVPESCPVTLANYFGTAELQDLQNGLHVNSEFCSIGLTNVQGTIGIKTRFGDLEGDQIKGDVNIQAKRSNITLRRLDGNFDIEAKYGIIEIFADQSAINLNINADRSDVYFYDSSLHAYNYTLAAHHGTISHPKRLDFQYTEDSPEMKRAFLLPKDEFGGVRIAINVSFGDIRIGP